MQLSDKHFKENSKSLKKFISSIEKDFYVKLSKNNKSKNPYAMNSKSVSSFNHITPKFSNNFSKSVTWSNKSENNRKIRSNNMKTSNTNMNKTVSCKTKISCISNLSNNYFNNSLSNNLSYCSNNYSSSNFNSHHNTNTVKSVGNNSSNKKDSNRNMYINNIYTNSNINRNGMTFDKLPTRHEESLMYNNFYNRNGKK